MMVYRNPNLQPKQICWWSTIGLRVVPFDTNLCSHDMKSVCLRRVWRWRFGKAPGGEDKPTSCEKETAAGDRPLCPRIFYVGRTWSFHVSSGGRLVVGVLAKVFFSRTPAFGMRLNFALFSHFFYYFYYLTFIPWHHIWRHAIKKNCWGVEANVSLFESSN